MSENQKRIKTDFIKELAELLSSSDLSELELEQDSFKLRLRRDRGETVIAAPVHVAAPAAAPAPVAAAPAAAPAAAAVAPAAANDSANPGAVKSPMVGTVYLSPEPGAKPFIDDGTQVIEGQTLMIVEAMKHMNQIAAPRSGTVTKVCVADGDPVEFDQVLVIIE